MKKLILLSSLILTIYANAQQLGNMYFLNENIGWIQTLHHYFTPINSYRTTNGGITWKQMDSRYYYLKTEFDERKSDGICFINDSVGYLVSVDSILYKTTDRGDTWKLLSNENKFAKVVFVNENVGYSKCTTGIYKTTNGGTTWDFLIESINDYPVYIHAVINENRVIVYSNYFRESYYLTTDGGVTWNKKTTTSQYYGTHYIIVVNFPDSLHGYLVLSLENPQNESHEGTYFSSDGGDSWHFKDQVRAPYFSMGDSINGVLYGSWSYQLTHDGFNTVEYKNNYSAFNYFYKSCKQFYSSGDSLYFAKSTDCGDTWSQIPFYVIPTSIKINDAANINYSLEQNYPNPFNPSTRISYNLLKSGPTTIKIYDVLGKEISTLVNEFQNSGNHEVQFNASELISGVYFYKINSGEYTDVKKMVLIK